MTWAPTYADAMALGFLLAMILWLRELAKGSKIKGILRAALRRSDNYGLGGRDTVRMDRNQAAELLGEDVDPNRGRKFSSGFDPVHPSNQRPHRRRKLKKGP